MSVTLPGIATRTPLRRLLHSGVTLTASADDNLPARMSQTGIVLGDFGWYSPAQVRGIARVEADEVYVLAVLCWELLHGRALRDREGTFEALNAIIRGELPVPLVRPEAAALEPVLTAALALEREARPATVGALAETLEAAVRPAEAATVGAWIAAALPAWVSQQRALVEFAAAFPTPKRGWIEVGAPWDGTLGQTTLVVEGRDGARRLIAVTRPHGMMLDDHEVHRQLAREASADDIVRERDGGLALVHRFVPGVEAVQLRDAGACAPPDVAVAIVAAAARALAARLTSGETRMMATSLEPGELHIGDDGSVWWTRIGPAPVPRPVTPPEPTEPVARGKRPRW